MIDHVYLDVHNYSYNYRKVINLKSYLKFLEICDIKRSLIQSSNNTMISHYLFLLNNEFLKYINIYCDIMFIELHPIIKTLSIDKSKLYKLESLIIKFIKLFLYFFLDLYILIQINEKKEIKMSEINVDLFFEID
jgi:hypothetical protein